MEADKKQEHQSAFELCLRIDQLISELDHALAEFRAEARPSSRPSLGPVDRLAGGTFVPIVERI